MGAEWFHDINDDWTKSSYHVSSGWKNNCLSGNPTVVGLDAAELAKSKYLHAGSRVLLKDFAKHQ